MAFCKDCKQEYYPFDGKMVMLNDKLWEKISDNIEDCLCNICIEKRLGREILIKDLKKSDTPNIFDNSDWIVCNQLWYYKNKK